MNLVAYSILAELLKNAGIKWVIVYILYFTGGYCRGGNFCALKLPLSYMMKNKHGKYFNGQYMCLIFATQTVGKT